MVDALNIATIAGLCTAVAAYFWAAASPLRRGGTGMHTAPAKTATGGTNKAAGGVSGKAASKANAGITPRERWRVASPVVAAFGLGYAFTWLFTAALAVALPAWFGVGRASAVFVATQWSFMVYTLVVIWAFSVRWVRTVWWGVLVIAALVQALLLSWRSSRAH